MWMIPPDQLCLQHLLGEHYELHKLVGFIRNGRDITRWTNGGYVNPSSIEARHQHLADELIRRGKNHNSPLFQPDRNGYSADVWEVEIDVDRAYRDLFWRHLLKFLRKKED